jgi:hypothetical protein
MLVQQQAAHNVQQANTKIKVQRLLLLVKIAPRDSIRMKWDKAAANKMCVLVVPVEVQQQVLIAPLIMQIYVQVVQLEKQRSLVVVSNVLPVKQPLHPQLHVLPVQQVNTKIKMVQEQSTVANHALQENMAIKPNKLLTPRVNHVLLVVGRLLLVWVLTQEVPAVLPVLPVNTTH